MINNYVIQYLVKYNHTEELERVLKNFKFFLIDDYTFPFEVSNEISEIFLKHKFYKTVGNIYRKRNEIENIVMAKIAEIREEYRV